MGVKEEPVTRVMAAYCHAKLTDTDGKPITRAAILLEDPAKQTHFGFGMGKALRAEGGVLRVENLEAGRKAVFVMPDRSDMECVGYHLTLREEVDLVAGRETVIDLVARRGGRLRVAVRDEQGALLDANAVLRDGRGRQLQVAYVSGGEDFASMSTGGPGTGSPSMVEPPLETGAYRLELSCPGRESKTLDVKVEVGKTTDVDVTLRKS